MGSQDSVSDTQVERPRRQGWGDETARRAMLAIAENLRLIAGFGSCVIDVLRGDDVLEFVAVATDDPATRDTYDGSTSPLSVLTPSLSQGREIGLFRFIRGDEMTPADVERLLPYSIVPMTEISDDEARWHPHDLLIVEVRDAQDRPRAYVYFDEPRDGLRPSSKHLEDLSEPIDQRIHAALVQIEREELTQRFRLANATRAVIRAASPHADLAEITAIVRKKCREPFRAQGLWFGTLDAFDGPLERPPGSEEKPEIGSEMRVAMKSAIGRAWQRQSVLIIESDHVWGDELLDRRYRDLLTPHVTERGLRAVVLVPIGAGQETLGMLAVGRDPDAPRWTEDESSAALDIAHDLGRAILNARANERERAAAAELRHVGDYRRTLIESVARELQHPLALVSGHLELLEAMDLPPQAHESLVPMIRNTARLTGLAQDLSLVSRLADSTSPPSLASLDLAQLATEAIEAVAPQAAHREVSFELAIDGDCSVQGHPLELSRCIGGLLDNAVKFSHRGGQVEVQVWADGDRVSLMVRDHGIGISSNDQDKLFGEFFRSSDPAALSRSGYGLGLSIVRQVAIRHGGTVTVESLRGQGATFRIVLPKDDRVMVETTW